MATRTSTFPPMMAWRLPPPQALAPATTRAVKSAVGRGYVVLPPFVVSFVCFGVAAGSRHTKRPGRADDNQKARPSAWHALPQLFEPVQNNEDRRGHHVGSAGASVLRASGRPRAA